jgi:hypothetical protein
MTRTLLAPGVATSRVSRALRKPSRFTNGRPAANQSSYGATGGMPLAIDAVDLISPL